MEVIGKSKTGEAGRKALIARSRLHCLLSSRSHSGAQGGGSMAKSKNEGVNST